MPIKISHNRLRLRLFNRLINLTSNSINVTLVNFINKNKRFLLVYAFLINPNRKYSLARLRLASVKKLNRLRLRLSNRLHNRSYNRLINRDDYTSLPSSTIKNGIKAWRRKNKHLGRFKIKKSFLRHFFHAFCTNNFWGCVHLKKYFQTLINFQWAVQYKIV